MRSRDNSSIDRKNEESSPVGYRWIILSLLWLLYASFGMVSRSITPLVTPILKDLDMSYSQMGFILGAWQLIYIVTALIAGTVIDQWGVRKSLLIGGVIIAISAMSRYFTKGFGDMLAAVALFGIGGPLISIGCPKTASMWFQGKERGTAVSIYLTGHWIGGILVLTTTNRFIMPFTGYSWRLTFFCYGLLTFLIALLWWFLSKDIRLTEKGEPSGIFEVFIKLVKVWNVKIVLIMGILLFATLHGFTSWLPKFLENRGFTSIEAGYMASLSLASGILFVLFIPTWISPPFRGFLVAMIALISIIALSTVIFSSGVLLFGGLILFGITFCSFPILTLILMDTHEVGSKHMGSAGGIFFCVAEIGGFTGPLIMGVLIDMTKTFGAGILFLVVLSLITMALAFLLRKRPA